MVGSYRPAELFNETGKLVPEIAEIAPKGDRRMAMNPITNAGVIKPMNTADWKKTCSSIQHTQVKSWLKT